MFKIDVTPQKVNIRGYAGDSLGIRITHPPGFVAGRIYSAQIRTSRTSEKVDATFDVLIGKDDDGVEDEDLPVTLFLPSDETRRLVGTKQKYQGVWDCQIAPPGGGDPAQTLIQGKVTLLLDVTRILP